MNRKLVISFLFLLIFNLIIACIHTTNYDVKYNDITIKIDGIDVKTKFPLDYYLLSEKNDGFNSVDIDVMQLAANDWNRLTNGIVKVNLHKGWTPPYPFDAELYRDLPFKSVWKFNWYSKEAQDLFSNAFDDYFEFCGLSWGNLIVIIDGTNKCGALYSTFAHELGHQFGLDHIKPKYSAVMNPRMGFKHISYYDIYLFCHLYGCLEEPWFLNQKY